MIKSKEFKDSTGCTVYKAYNHYSKDTYSDAYSNSDIEEIINEWLKDNPDIEIIRALYTDGTSYHRKMPVKVSKMLLIYKTK